MSVCLQANVLACGGDSRSPIATQAPLSVLLVDAMLHVCQSPADASGLVCARRQAEHLWFSSRCLRAGEPQDEAEAILRALDVQQSRIVHVQSNIPARLPKPAPLNDENAQPSAKVSKGQRKTKKGGPQLSKIEYEARAHTLLENITRE
jgi:hypothetical protein